MAYILLVEPNKVLATTYRQVLQHMGHQVDHVAGAQAAIMAADAQTPDMVILELQLARHSGLEFLHEFRSYAEWQAIPVVVHTDLPPSRTAFASAALQEDLGVTA